MCSAMRSFTASIVLLSMAASGAVVQHRESAWQRPARAMLTDELLDRFIVIPEHKLLFCYIEKVGCSSFNELFRQLRARYDPSQLHGNMWGKNTPFKRNVTKADLEAYLVDESWHKAVFWRDPVERFASGYLSKCGPAHEYDGPRVCQAQFGAETLSFASAVAYISDQDYSYSAAGNASDNKAFNVHFRRMRRFCGGLAGTIGYYNTVEELDVRSSHEKVSRMLRTVGVDPASIPGFNGLFPPTVDAQKVWKSTSNWQSKHNTNATAQMATLFPPFEPWLERILFHHYKEDYQLFNITHPRGTTASASAESLFAGEALSMDARWPLLDELLQPVVTEAGLKGPSS